MAIFGASNQLLQIDTGAVRTYLFNPALSPIQVYANIGEVQTPGQRYFGVSSSSAVNPFGAPGIYMLVKYLSTSAVTTANLTTAAAPAPVYWTDNTFTTVSGIQSEAANGNQSIAGYLMANTTDIPSLTAAMLVGAQVIIQVAGFLSGAYGPTASAAANSAIIGASGAFQSAGVAAGTAPGYRTAGIQLSAVASGLCNVLVNADII